MAQRTLGQVQKRIASLSAEIAKLQLEYTKLKSQGKSNAEIQKQLGAQFASLTKKLTTLTNVTKQYNNQTKTTAKNANTANAALAKTTTQYSKLSNAITGASASQKTLGQAFLGSFTLSTVGRIAAYLGIYQLLYAAINAVKEITLGSIKAFVNFEDSIGKLRAVLGASAEETQILSDSIRKTAVETRFTATQVTELATSLSKLGATSEEIPNLILPVALAAQALGVELDKVGETIFKVNNQFGLSAAESATTAQTLVSAINSSALSLDTFNTAIQYIGPIASQVGLSFSETSAYLETLADNGFSASRIGTGLRGIFIDLKEAGVPLIDTLQKLADENISVARATDLVGKRAAAQLITLIDNIEILKEYTAENSRSVDALRASAAQMATTAGQLDILKSAYEDLRISIGETITNTEFFLDLIGLLSTKSEQLARGYTKLDTILSSQDGAEVLQSNFDQLAKGTVNSLTALETTLKTYARLGESPELLRVFQKLQEEGLTLAEINGLISKRVNDGEESLERYVGQMGLTQSQAAAVYKQLDSWTAPLDEITDQFNELRGVSRIIQEQATAIQTANQVSQERNRIEQEYADDIERVQALGPGTVAAQEESRKIQKELNQEIKDTQDQLDIEKEKGIIANRVLINQLEGRISGYKNVKKELADLGYMDEEDSKKAEEARKKQLKLDKDDISRRKAELQERLRQIKKIRDEEIKSIEERRKLESGRAATSEERANIELKAAADIKKANEELGNELKVVADETRKLTDDTLELKQKYQEFPDAFDDFATQFEKLLFDISTAQESVITDPAEFANQLLASLNNVMSGFEQSLAELKEYYGDTAQGQVDFADASVREFERLKDSLDSLVGQYYSMKAGLEVAFGPQAAAVILGPLSAAIDTAEKRLNAMGMSIKQNAENVAKDVSEQYRQLYIDGLEDALKTAIEALDRFNEVAYENTKDRIEREQDLVDARYSAEEDILKAQLDNQLITEAEYLNKKNQLRRKQIGEENTLEKALFDASQRRDKQNATADYLQALASIIPNLILYDKTADPVTLTAKSIITGALATAAYGSELAAIGQRKFIPKKFAEGGFVSGPSHDDGGVPFTVQGRGGYEMEGGEFIVNKRAAQLHKNVLERINNSTRPTVQNGKLMFETGGVIPINGITASTLQSSAGGAEATLAQLDYLRAIAETNVNISQNTSKPVRAYVTSADLSSNTAERKIKERNTLI